MPVSDWRRGEGAGGTVGSSALSPTHCLEKASFWEGKGCCSPDSHGGVGGYHLKISK